MCDKRPSRDGNILDVRRTGATGRNNNASMTHGTALADDFMRRREWYEMTQPFKGDSVPIVNELSDGLPEDRDVGHVAVVANRLPMGWTPVQLKVPDFGF